MAKEELRKFLESSNDKFKVLSDAETVKPYQITIKELLELIDEFLDDEQKIALLSVNYAQKPIIKRNIVMLIKDESKILDVIFNKELTNGLETNDFINIIQAQNSNCILQILNNVEFLEENKIKKYQIIDIIKLQDSGVILQILNNSSLLEKCKLGNFEIEALFKNLDEKEKLEFLSNPKYIKEKLKLSEYRIGDMISSITDEKTKENLIKSYELNNLNRVNIICQFSDEGKERNILNNTLGLRIYDYYSILSNMETDNLIRFINNNLKFLAENNIAIYNIVEKLNVEKQKELVYKIDNLKIEMRRKT